MTTPKHRAPYRADHVGSLLRPPSVVDARRALSQGKVSASDLRTTEDDAVKDLVSLQESAGLLAATDGECRRSFWHYDFMSGLTGIELEERGEGVQFQGATLPPVHPTIKQRVDFPSDHPMLGHFRYLASVTKSAQPKFSIPGPSSCHFRMAANDIEPPEYRDLDVLFDDIALAYKKAVGAFYDAGCRYLQMDDIFFAYLCDENIRAQKKAEGLDPDWLITRYAKMMNDAISARPSDMVIAMHLCRGNFKSTWVASGGYDPAADAIFNSTDVDVYFMEYDTERAGGLAPLRLLPKGKKRVLPGFVTTKTGTLETIDDLKQKFEQASKYADIDQLGIAPQCGFASTEHGNDITPDEQKRKLELVVETANAIWGGVDA